VVAYGVVAYENRKVVPCAFTDSHAEYVTWAKVLSFPVGQHLEAFTLIASPPVCGSGVVGDFHSEVIEKEIADQLEAVSSAPHEGPADKMFVPNAHDIRTEGNAGGNICR